MSKSTLTDDAAAPKCATLDDLLGGVKSTLPQPLDEYYTLPETSLTFHIVGITSYDQREQIRARVREDSRAAKDGKLRITVPGDTWTPDEMTIAASIWCRACVKEPQLSIEQWRVWAHEAEQSRYLQLLFDRALICSRIVAEQSSPAQSDGEAAPTPSGDEEAKEMLLGDPLATGGAAFAGRS